MFFAKQPRPLVLLSWIFIFVGSSAFYGAFYVLSIKSDSLPIPRDASLLYKDFDDLSLRAYQRASSESISKTDVIFLGSSVAREALYPDEIFMEKYFKNSTHPLKIVHLVSNGQSFLEALFLLDLAKVRKGQTIIVITSAANFLYAYQKVENFMEKNTYLQTGLVFANSFQEELPYLKPYLETRAKQETMRRSYEMFFHRNIYNRIMNLSLRYIHRKPLLRPYQFEYLEKLPKEKTRRQIEWTRENFYDSKFDEKKSQQLVLTLKVLVKHLKRKGVDFYFINQPLLVSNCERIYGKVCTFYDNEMQKLSSELGFDFFNFNDSLNFVESDFAIDLRHTIESGRAKFSGYLAKWISENVGKSNGS